MLSERTAALHCALTALDVGPGDEVILPAWTWYSCYNTILLTGALPVFAEVDESFGLDPEDVERKITSRTKAIMAVHLYGGPADMDRILAVARKRKLRVLEDAAQSVGAQYKGRRLGSIGDIGIYSFQTSKVITAGEGGMGMYQTREYYERAAAFGHYEDPPKFPKDSPYRRYDGTGFGQKYRMHPFAAAVARQQLKSLDERNALVASQVRKLNDRLTQLPGLAEPRCRPDQKRAYYSANMLLLDEAKAGFSRAALLKALQAEGVRASVWDYPEQHKFKIYSEAKWWHHPPEVPDILPGGAQVNRSHLFVPLFYTEVPELVEQYTQAFEKVWAHRAKLAEP